MISLTIYVLLILQIFKGTTVLGQTTDIVWKIKNPGTSDGSDCNKPNLNVSDLFDCSHNTHIISCKCNKCSSSQDSGAQVHLECIKNKWYPTKESNILCARKFDHDTVKCEHNDCICKNNCKRFTLDCGTSSIGNKIKNNCGDISDLQKSTLYKDAQSKQIKVDYLLNGWIKLSCKDKEYELQGHDTQACRSKLESNKRCVKKSSIVLPTTNTSVSTTTITNTTTTIPIELESIMNITPELNNNNETSNGKSVLLETEIFELYILLGVVAVILALLMIVFTSFFVMLLRSERRNKNINK